jgi:hypothetical protein
LRFWERLRKRENKRVLTQRSAEGSAELRREEKRREEKRREEKRREEKRREERRGEERGEFSNSLSILFPLPPASLSGD